MEGIRLRSDSTGSAKSAFYQGTIVCAPKPGTSDATAIESRRGKRNGSRRKEKKPPPGREHEGAGAHYLAEPHDLNVMPDFHADFSSPPPVSPFAPPGGYYCRNPQPYDSQRQWMSQGYPQIRSGGFFESLGKISDRSTSLSLSDRQDDLHTDSSSGWRDAWFAGMRPQSSHGRDAFLDESPSMDETELKGVSLDLESSPLPSPTKRTFPSRDESTLLSVGRLSYPPPPPPPPAGYPFSPTSMHHQSQKGPVYAHQTYGTSLLSSGPVLNHWHHISDSDFGAEDTNEESKKIRWKSFKHCWNLFDFSTLLTADIKYDEDGNPQLDGSSWSSAAFMRLVLYNPIYPEFTSLQQFNWAVILGISMGFLTAVWKALIEFCVEFVWKTVPEFLYSWGLFTDLDGFFPIYHYMWITPAVFGGVLSYIFAALPTPIPGQNDWIHSLHSRGVQESDTLGLLFLLSTAGMASGLSLGPELPLILTSGMIGSWLGVLCKQSILSARVLNLTAASAAIGGFFGFPMAGALFVLEVPHRMGLQYFEALSPATIASIVAVLTNRLATGNDVTGYYEYPFLNESLPSSIFHDAIVLGLFGGAIGIIYTKVILLLKSSVHDLFHRDEGHEEVTKQDVTHITESTAETTPLVFDDSFHIPKGNEKAFNFVIAHGPTRAGVVGTIVGILVGVTCMFFPHVMFWGESQLQNLIDKGRTPLPVFGYGDEPSAGLVALGYCMVDRKNESNVQLGFSIGCSATISIAKIFVTGLSLGTGIVGGHFWAPLFVGCTASHFLTDSVGELSSWLGVSMSLSAYPCVALLCIMGSCHVVTFRAHIAIILILTLTIDAFNPEDGVVGAIRVAGDYSAVFPLLTVAVFVALQISRQTVFYEKQRSRGDITALPEVLCEPGKEGRPLVMDYDGNLHELDENDYDYEGEIQSDGDSEDPTIKFRTVYEETTQSEIEAQFKAQIESAGMGCDCSVQEWIDSSPGPPSQVPGPLPPRPQDRKAKQSHLNEGHPHSVSPGDNSNRLSISGEPVASKCLASDELLNVPLTKEACPRRKTHRRTRSEPFHDTISMSGAWAAPKPLRERSDSGCSNQVNPKMPVSFKRVSSFGQVDQEQPSLLDQARKRAASFAFTEKPRSAQPKGIPSPRTENRKRAVA